MASAAAGGGGEEAIPSMETVLGSIHAKMAAATEVAKAKGAYTHDPRLVAGGFCNVHVFLQRQPDKPRSSFPNRW